MTLKSFTFLSALVVFISCGSNDTSNVTAASDGKQLTTIQWIDSVRNFGKITEGQKLAVSFRFKNSGDKPLIIESVQPACGCTIADYPRQPIKPGEEGEITGEFNSEGREGQQHKEMTVTTNTAAHTQNIVFEVTVVGRPPEATK